MLHVLNFNCPLKCFGIYIRRFRPNRNYKLCLQGEDADEDDAYQVLSTLKRITAFHKYDECGDFIA